MVRRIHLAAAAQNVRQIAWPEPTPPKVMIGSQSMLTENFGTTPHTLSSGFVVALLHACPRNLHSAPDLWDLPSMQEQKK